MNAGGCPVPSGIPSVSVGSSRAAASCGVSASASGQPTGRPGERRGRGSLAGKGVAWRLERVSTVQCTPARTARVTLPIRGNVDSRRRREARAQATNVKQGAQPAPLGAQAGEDDLEVALPGERRRPGALRTARPMPQISPGTSQGSVSARAACPRPSPGRSGAVTTSIRPTDSAASPQTYGALVHRLGEQPVLGHHLGRVGHELDEPLPAVLGLQRPRGPPRRGARSAPGRGPRAGSPWSGSGGRRCRRRPRRRARSRRSGRRGHGRRTACAPTRSRPRGCGARRRAGDGRWAKWARSVGVVGVVKGSGSGRKRNRGSVIVHA